MTTPSRRADPAARPTADPGAEPTNRPSRHRSAPPEYPLTPYDNAGEYVDEDEPKRRIGLAVAVTVAIIVSVLIVVWVVIRWTPVTLPRAVQPARRA